MKSYAQDPSPATPPADSHETRSPRSLLKGTKTWVAIAAAASLLLFGYHALVDRSAIAPAPPGTPGPLGYYAVAYLTGPNSNVTGAVHFTQPSPAGPVTITGKLKNLDPNSDRGFHIHEFGDATDGCMSSGSHYNPLAQTHAGPDDIHRHVGDLGNIHSDADGIAKLDFSDNVISLTGPFSIIGRTVVVHTGTDDLGRGGNEDSLKTGNAGGRAACGVVGFAKKP